MRRMSILPFSVAALALAGLLAAPAAAATKHVPVPPASPAPPAVETPPAPPEPPEPVEPPSAKRLGDKVVIGSSLAVAKGETVVGDVVCVGCRGRIDGEVLGDVVIVGGRVEITGTMRGQCVSVFSRTRLDDAAVVRGDLVNVGGKVERDHAQIGGRITDLGLGGLLSSGSGNPFRFFGFFGLWITVFGLVLVFLGLLVLSALVPERVRRIGEEAASRWFVALFAGIATYTVVVIGFFILMVTIVGIPAALLGYIAFVVLKWLGLAGIFHAVGSRIGRALGRDLRLLPAVLLGFLPFAVIRFVPFCCGFLFWFALEIIGVGLVVLTRAGGPSRSPGVLPPAAVDPPAAGPAI